MKYRYIKEYGRSSVIFMNIVEDRDGELYLLKYCALEDKIWTSYADEKNKGYVPYTSATAVEEISEEDFFLEFI